MNTTRRDTTTNAEITGAQIMERDIDRSEVWQFVYNSLRDKTFPLEEEKAKQYINTHFGEFVVFGVDIDSDNVIGLSFYAASSEKEQNRG